jgi:hypothetical protein
MFKSFQEYIDQNKKLVEKPKVAKIADFEGKQPRKPEKESLKKTDCGCSSGGKGQVGEASPYSNGENAKDPNKDDKAGLVYKGDQKLVYEPNVDEKSKETKTWPKTGMSEWLKDTRNLSIAEFTRRLKEENGNCSEGVQDAAKKLVEACKCNKKNLLTLVREARRGKILEGLMKEVFNTPESFEILSKLIESKKYSNKFDKMFSEMVAEPMGMDGGSMGDMGDMGEEGEEDHEGMGDDDMDMGDEEGHDDDHEEDEEGEEGDEDEGDEDEEDHDDMEDMEDEEDHDDMDMGDEEGHEGAGMGMGMNMGPNSNENPFLPKEATWHPRMMKSMRSIDAPESARERLTSMREPFSDEEKRTDGGAYPQLKIQLMDAKKRVKEIEAKMITLVQMGRADGVYEAKKWTDTRETIGKFTDGGSKAHRAAVRGGYTDGPEGEKKRMHELTKVRELESELRTAKQKVKELESEMDKFLKSIGKK